MEAFAIVGATLVALAAVGTVERPWAPPLLAGALGFALPAMGAALAGVDSRIGRAAALAGVPLAAPLVFWFTGRGPAWGPVYAVFFLLLSAPLLAVAVSCPSAGVPEPEPPQARSLSAAGWGILACTVAAAATASVLLPDGPRRESLSVMRGCLGPTVLLAAAYLMRRTSGGTRMVTVSAVVLVAILVGIDAEPRYGSERGPMLLPLVAIAAAGIALLPSRAQRWYGALVAATFLLPNLPPRSLDFLGYQTERAFLEASDGLVRAVLAAVPALLAVPLGRREEPATGSFLSPIVARPAWWRRSLLPLVAPLLSLPLFWLTDAP